MNVAFGSLGAGDGRQGHQAGAQVQKGSRPVVLQFVYFRCTSLCSAVLNSTLETFKLMKMQPGRDFDVISVSINPNETANLARAKKAAYLKELGRPEVGEGWHFLTGTRPNIQRLAAAAGFGYRFDLETREYAHGAGLFVITPEGKISRTIFGAIYEPQTLRLSLVEAADGKIGTALDRIYLFCYHYDPDTGLYTRSVMRITRLLGLGLLFALLSTVGFLLWREARGKKRSGEPVPEASASAGAPALPPLASTPGVSPVSSPATDTPLEPAHES